MRQKLYFIFALLSTVFFQVNAQQIDTTLAKYVNDFPQEKIHIHFDKGIYNKGETIWLKGYVLAGLDLSDFSRNFYVDWYNDQGVLIKHTANPMFESSAKAQFDIPADYAGKFLHVKAYTQWMLNFDSAFIYNKDIRIDQPVDAINAAILNGESSKEVTANANTVTTAKTPATSIHFFPEGGDMVTGINGRVAFLTENQFGLPVKAVGAINSSQGVFIDSFKTEHDGMGSFTFQPDSAQSYTATWTDEYGATHTTPLPQAKEKTASLEVQLEGNKLVFSVKRGKDIPGSLQKMYVLGHMHQNPVFKAVLVPGEKLFMSGQAPTADLPTGVLQITLFDSNYRPLAERVVFINNNEYRFTPQVRITGAGLGKKERNTVEIEVDDSLLTNMSVAVTDAGLWTDTAANIISDLLLSGDVKGYIHNPAYYFKSNADSVKHFLDLVMMTHGWRRFDWKKVAAGKTPVVKYPKETSYMQLKGTIYGAPYKGAMKDQHVFVIMQGKDSTKNQSLMLPIDNNNNFGQEGIFFYDTLRAYYQLTGSKSLTDMVEVGLQTGLVPALFKNYAGTTPLPNLWAYQAAKDSMTLKRSRLFFAESEKIKKQLQAHELATVTVTTRAKKKVDVLDEKYASGLFSGGDAHQFDVTTDPSAAGALDVFSYLQGKVAGLIITNGAEVSLKWRGSTPELYLDEMKADADMLKGIPMSEVAYIKVFSPPFFGAAGGGAGGAIAVYTRKGGDVKPTSGKGISYKLLTGYTPYKQFYTPDYKNSTNSFTEDDVRTTLYWNPFVLTDKKKRTVQIEFYNNDISQKLWLVLEGMNSEGKVTRVEKVIQ